MAYSKGSQFSSQQQVIAKLAKAISHPARIAIIEHLMHITESNCGEIVERVGLAQPTVSQHLKELRLADIVSCKVHGNLVRYKLNERTLEVLGLYVIYIQNKLAPHKKLKVMADLE